MIKTRVSTSRRRRPLRRAAHFVAGIFLALVLTGCGDSGNQEDRAAERTEALQQIRAEIVAEAFESGRLGPKDELLAEMEEVAVKETVVDEETFEEKVPRFFTKDGHLISWDELDENQRGAYTGWISTSEKVHAVVGGEMKKAQEDYDRD